MKYVILFCTLSFTGIKVNAQYYKTHKQDTLRWFIGKWVDNKTFKIDSTVSGKGGGGGKIAIMPGGTLKFNAPGEQKFEDNINESITKIETEEKDIVKANKQAQGMYQFSLEMKL